MRIAIIKYNAGNIQSVLYAMERLGVEAEVTDDAEKIKGADKVLFPGVGEASSAMQSLIENDLDKVIKDLKQPVFGICVGMQLLCNHSEENNTSCLGIVPIQFKKFLSTSQKSSSFLIPSPSGEGGRRPDEGEGAGVRKVPQIGWNNIYNLKSELFKGIEDKSFIYNVHSYYAEDSEYTIATCSYGIEYAAAVKKDNFYGVQFHTEKSAEIGDKILKNFIEIHSTFNI